MRTYLRYILRILIATLLSIWCYHQETSYAKAEKAPSQEVQKEIQ